LERAAQDRVGLAVAVDHVARAVGRKVESNRKASQIPVKASLESANSRSQILSDRQAQYEVRSSQPVFKHNRYRQLWQQYAEGYMAKSETTLDFEVGRQIFLAGYSQKEVALVLVAGSSTVRRLANEQGKEKARLYANWVADLIVNNRQEHQTPGKIKRSVEMELGD
jgi:hypothetical protein